MALKKQLSILTGFGIAQIILQLLQLGTLFLVLRLLDKPNYGQYSAALSIQAVVLAFSNVVSGSVINPLVGQDTNNQERIGKLVCSAYKLRIHFFLVAIVPGLFYLIFTSIRQNWPPTQTTGLALAITISAYASGLPHFYRPILLMKRDVNSLYQAMITCEVIRFALIVALCIASQLNATFIVLVTALSQSLLYAMLKKSAMPYIASDARADEETRREIMQFTRPLFPGAIFNSFQSQIMVLIAGIFCDTTTLANAGVLQRLVQLWTLPKAAVNTLLAPRIAATGTPLVKKRYLLYLSRIFLFTICTVAVAIYLRQYLLLAIGQQYQNLEPEISLFLVISGILFLCDAMWSFQYARKWTWWWMPLMSITSILLIQFGSAFALDLTVLWGVLMLQLWTATGVLLFRIFCMAVGLSQLNRTQST